MSAHNKTRNALITGAGQGIGRGLALRFAAAGHRVLIAELNEQTGASVSAEIAAAGGNAQFLPTDICDPASIDHAVDWVSQHWGGTDILIDNAYTADGISRLEEKSFADLEHCFSGSFYGAFHAMKAVFPAMRERAWGRIINLCTLNGVNAHLYTSGYNASKEALRCLTRSAAREWAALGITVNAICPAAVTPAFEHFQQQNPSAAAAAVAANPMQRMGDPERDIAGVALFLAGDDAGYVTGNTLFVDGGAHINGAPWQPQLGD